VSAFTAAVARPFAAAGELVRVTSTVLFSRGRGWALWISRSRVNYKHDVGDPLTNSIVGAVVGWIARNFPEAPVRIIREDDPEGTPIRRSKTGPGAMLRLLERPNSWFSGVVMWKATIVDYLRGDAYWFKVRSGSGRVVELWWIPKTMMKPHWPQNDPSVFIDYYEYIVDGISYRVETADVVHFRNGMNPATQGRTGVDELDALWREVYTDEEAAAFTAALLKNLGIPGVVIAPSNTTGPRVLQADPEAVKKKFMERFEGDHRGEPLVFGTPTDVKVLSWNPQQLDLKSLRRVPEERISARLGVPAGVAGLGAGLDRNTFTNVAEANVSAYTQGVIPRQREIAAELEVQLLPEFVGDALETYDVYFDAQVTSAMRGLLESIWKLASSDARAGLLTRAEYKRLTGQKVADNGYDDVYVLANNIRIINRPAVGTGGQGPSAPTPRPAPPQLQPGAVDGPVALLEAGPAEIHCSSCGRLLAEQASAPYRFTCGRCKAVTTSSGPQDAQAAPSARPDPVVGLAAAVVMLAERPLPAPQVNFAEGAFRAGDVFVPAVEPAPVQVDVAPTAVHVHVPDPKPVRRDVTRDAAGQITSVVETTVED
jgi:HK97 family phage portal protein